MRLRFTAIPISTSYTLHETLQIKSFALLKQDYFYLQACQWFKWSQHTKHATSISQW